MIAPMGLSDEQIGQRLAILRGSESQSGLAVRMRDRGFKWSQATVWSIEKGERPLRFSEAVELSALLGYQLEQLIGDELDLQMQVLFVKPYAAARSSVVTKIRKAVSQSLDRAQLMDQIGQPLTGGVDMEIHNTILREFHLHYWHLVTNEIKKRTGDEGPFASAVLDAWERDRDLLRQLGDFNGEPDR